MVSVVELDQAFLKFICYVEDHCCAPFIGFFLGLLPCCVSALSLLYVPCVTNCILAFAWLSHIR